MPAKYKLTKWPQIILRPEDNTFIPTDESNKDYRDYQAWVALGNTPDPEE